MSAVVQKEVPAELKKWNWGAFLLHWIWGIGNNSYKTFLIFIPVFNIYWMFVIGAKANEWAWQAKDWESVEQFQATQRKWTKAALIIFGVIFALYAVMFIMMAGAMSSMEVPRY